MTTKTKKIWLKRILKSLLLTLTISVIMPLTFQGVAHAEGEASCPAGWSGAGTNQCFKAGPYSGEDCGEEGYQFVAGSHDNIPGMLCSKTDKTSSGVDSKELESVAALLVSLQKFMNRAIWPILIMIGGLLDSSLLYGSGMETTLREIWIPIRNIVNILFVLGLVGVALYNVLGLGDDQSTYSVKAILPKIIVAIIAVNFSFLGIKVVLDTVNVLTVSVFSLPNQVSQGLSELSIAKDPSKMKAGSPEQIEVIDSAKRFCHSLKGKTISENFTGQETEDKIYEEAWVKHNKGNQIIGKTKVLEAIDALKTETEEQKKFKKDIEEDIDKAKKSAWCDEKGALTENGQAFLKEYNTRNAALAMVLSNSKILFYQDLKINADTIEKVVISSLFSMLLYVMYVVSFLSLFIILLARIVVLWLTIAMSPILMLSLAIPDIKEKLGTLGDLSTQFLKHAIAPLIIALSMTVGWIMLGAINGLSTFEEGSVFNFNPSDGIPVVGFSSLQDLIVALGTVAVVWMGIKAAAKDTFAEGAVTAITGFAESAGKWIGQLPLKHIPAVPVRLPNGDVHHATLSQIHTAARNVFTDTSSKDRELYSKMGLDRKPNLEHLGTKDLKNEFHAYALMNRFGSDIKSGNATATTALKGLQNNTPVFSKVDPDLQKLVKQYNETDEKDKKATLGAQIVEKAKRLEKEDADHFYKADYADESKTAKTSGGKEIGPDRGYGADNTISGHANNDKIKAEKAAKDASEALTNLSKSIEKKEAKSEILKKVKALAITIDGNVIVPILPQVKEYLGDDYDKLVTQVGGEEEVKKALANAKPSTGTAGTAGAAAAAPATPPAAPAAPAAPAPADDIDRDGIHNDDDPDRDGDGTNNSADQHPNDPARH